MPLNFRIFKKKPQPGKPLAIDGMAAALNFMARAWETLDVWRGRVDWNDGRPLIIVDELENGVPAPLYLYQVTGTAGYPEIEAHRVKDDGSLDTTLFNFDIPQMQHYNAGGLFETGDIQFRIGDRFVLVIAADGSTVPMPMDKRPRYYSTALVAPVYAGGEWTTEIVVWQKNATTGAWESSGVIDSAVIWRPTEPTSTAPADYRPVAQGEMVIPIAGTTSTGLFAYAFAPTGFPVAALENGAPAFAHRTRAGAAAWLRVAANRVIYTDNAGDLKTIEMTTNTVLWRGTSGEMIVTPATKTTLNYKDHSDTNQSAVVFVTTV